MEIRRVIARLGGDRFGEQVRRFLVFALFERFHALGGEIGEQEK